MRGVHRDARVVQGSDSVPCEQHQNVDGNAEQDHHSVPHEPTETNERHITREKLQLSQKNSRRISGIITKMTALTIPRKLAQFSLIYERKTRHTKNTAWL